MSDVIGANISPFQLPRGFGRSHTPATPQLIRICIDFCLLYSYLRTSPRVPHRQASQYAAPDRSSRLSITSL